MKYLIVALSLILFTCKSEVNSENEVDKSVYEMWDNFTKFNPKYNGDPIPESWYFHNNQKDANRLAELTLKGKKKASSGLYSWYKEADADLPVVGTKHIITNFDGKAQAIIEIKKVDTIPFNLISATYAELDMGTHVEPLKKWKKAHWDFFQQVLEQDGKKPTIDMSIVCERFEVIWKEVN